MKTMNTMQATQSIQPTLKQSEPSMRGRMRMRSAIFIALAAAGIAIGTNVSAQESRGFHRIDTESEISVVANNITRIAPVSSPSITLAPGAAAKLSALKLKSATTAVAIADARLLESTEAGAWRDISPTPSSHISAFQFIDAKRGVAIDRDAASPQFFRTNDGGDTWQMNALPLSGEFAGVKMHFVDHDRGYVIARTPSSANFSFARLYATNDGGATWSELARPPIMGEIKFVSHTRGFILGGADGRSLYQTIDAGQSWQRISIGDVSTPAMPIMQNGALIVPVLTNTDDNARATLSQFSLHTSGALHLLSRTELVVNNGDALELRIQSGVSSIVLLGDAYAANASAVSALPVVIDSTGTLREFAERDGARWLLAENGGCSGKGSCITSQQLATVDAFGDAFAVNAPMASLSTVLQNDLQKRIVQSTNRGFDACSAPSTSTLQTWYNSSPYKDVNFYMGGRNRACSQPNLTASWLTTAMNQGWNLIPTWVGYQSQSTICTGCAKYSSNSTTARQQGVDEANLAADAAEALGLTKPNMIYFNLEKYDVETQSDKSFIDGWSAQIRARGYEAGMYVHWTNVASFTSLTNTPRAIWVARWGGVGGSGPSTIPDPNAITGVSNSIFVNNRIWQHWGDITQTWGGATIAIDMNVSNGPLVGKDVAQQSQSITFGTLGNRTINTAAFNLSASASSGLAVTFNSQTPSTCTVTGTRATLLAVGTCTFRASQAGNASYFAAANVDQSFTINAQSQTITFATIPSRVLSPTTFDLNATTSSGLLPTYSSLTTSICTVNGDRLSTLALGTCTVRASQSGNAKVTAAASVDQSFSVIAISSCSTSVSTGDCDLDGIPNGQEASSGKSPTVRDNDVFTSTNLFIRQAFRDFLKREATSTEISTWTTNFNNGTQNRASMLESFLSSAEFGQKHAPVARLYLGAFNRVPQWTGQQYWAGQVGTRTVAQIADAFVTSAEWITTYGTLDDTPYVNRIYQNTLGRAPTSTELSTALNALAGATKTRGGLLADLTQGTTYQNATRAEVNMIMIYWGMLQRRADQSGFDYWVNQIETGAKTTNGVITGFLGAAEYRSRFLP
jgi:photosystem II stability/assembly factor-like uncharacterized protein